MSDSHDFRTLIQAVRKGDAEAAAQLVQHYEADLRIIARVKLNDPGLRRVVDSMDICQSILGNFFFRASAGQFDLETPDQLMKLLATMIRNKVTDQARRHHADRRDQGRLAEVDIHEHPLASQQDTPSQIVAARELAQHVRQRLSPEECLLVDRRMDGRGWEEIATELGGHPEALRKQMTRALDRVAAELKLDPSDVD